MNDHPLLNANNKYCVLKLFGYALDLRELLKCQPYSLPWYHKKLLTRFFNLYLQ